MLSRANPNFSSYNRDDWTRRPANELNSVSMPDYSQLFDQDTGSKYQMLAEDIVQTTIMYKNDFILSDILPQKRVDQTSITIDSIEFDPTTMDENPELGEAKLLTFNRRRRTVRIQRRGIQAAMEDGFKNDPLGASHWGRYMLAMVHAGVDTLIIHALMALQDAPLEIPDKIRKRNQRYAGRTAAAYMQEKAFFFGIVQTSDRPFEACDSYIRDEMAAIGGDYDTLILPSKLSGHVKAAKSYYLDYDKAGPAGPALAKSDSYERKEPSSYPGFSNTRIYVIHTHYEAAALNNNQPLLSNLKEIGEYYHLKSHVAFDNPNWTKENQHIELYDQESDERFRVGMLDCIRNSLVMDQDGVRPLSDLPYDQGDVSYNPSSRTHGDMWSATETSGVHRFGDMPPHTFNISQMSAWANGVAAVLDRRQYLTKKQWEEITTSLGQIPQPDGTYDFSKISEAERAGFGKAVALLKSIFQDTNEDFFEVPGWLGENTPAKSFYASVIRPYYPPLYTVNHSEQKAMDVTKARNFVMMLFEGDPENLKDFIAKKKPNSREETIDAFKEVAKRRAYALAGGAEYHYQYKTSEAPRKLSPEATRRAEELYELESRILDSWEERDDDPAYELVPNSFVTREKGKQILDSKKFGEMPGDLLEPWRPMTEQELRDYVTGNGPVAWNSDYDLAAYNVFVNPKIASAVSEFSSKIGAVKPGQDLLAVKDYQINLGVLAETNFLTNWSNLTKHLTGVPRLIMALFLAARVRLSFFETLDNFNLPIPFEAVIFRPFISHLVVNGIACKRGMANLGYSAVGNGMFTQGSDPGSQSTKAHFTQYLGAVITHPWNAYILEAMMVIGYYRGKGRGWIDPAMEMARNQHRNNSMIPHILPLGTSLPAVISVTGSPNDLEEFNNLHIADEEPIPDFIRLRRTFGTWTLYTQTNNDQNLQPIHENFMCMAGKYWYRGEREFDQIHSGRGHFKDTDGPGAKAVREGGLMSYRPDTGANYKH